MYKVYVLPIILYCCPLYCPPTKSLPIKLEKIKRYFTRRLYNRGFTGPIPDYSTRLRLLGLITLNAVFKKTDLLTIYRLINNRIPSHSFNFRFSTRSPHRILLSRINTNIARKYFTNRACCMWNKLIPPDSIANIHVFNKYLSSDRFLSAIDSRT